MGASSVGRAASTPLFESPGTVKYSLLSLSRREMRRAARSDSGSSSTRVPSPWASGDVLLALRAGAKAPQNHTGVRTLQVLFGRIRVEDARTATQAFPGEVVCCGGAATVVAVADTVLLVTEA